MWREGEREGGREGEGEGERGIHIFLQYMQSIVHMYMYVVTLNMHA